MKTVLAVAMFGLFLCQAAPGWGQSAIYVVRHAEKVSEMPDAFLSDQGKKRAKALAALLKNANIKAIYTSHVERTKQTAMPLAMDRNLMINVIQNGDPTATFEKIRADHPHDAVLVVGHSNTVDDIVEKWVPDAGINDLADNEYDKIFLVIPQGAKAAWVRFEYRGEAP